jgi:hypothetical protein
MCKKLMFLISLVSLVALVGTAQGVWCMDDGVVCAPEDEVDLCDLWGPPPVFIDDDVEFSCDNQCYKLGCDVHITGRWEGPANESCDQQVRLYTGTLTVEDRMYMMHDGGPQVGRFIAEGDIVINTTSGSSSSFRTADNGGQARVIFKDDAVLNNNGGWRAGDSDGNWTCMEFLGNCYISVNEYIRIGDDGVGEIHIDGGTIIVHNGWFGQFGRGGDADYGPSSMSAGEVWVAQQFSVIVQKVNATFDMSGGVMNARDFDVCRDSGNGTLTMTGGLIIARENFNCPRGDDGVAHAQLDGGEVRCDNLSLPLGGTMDITGGTLVVNGNKVAEIGALVCVDERLTGYGAAAGVVINYDAANDKTIVTADPDFDPLAAYCPSPVNGALAKCVSEDVILSWKGTTGVRDRHAVYYGLDCDAVAAATPADPEFKGYVPGSRPPMWIAGRFPLKSVVCWRIDEIYYGGPTVAGPLWSFSCDCPELTGDLNEDCIVNFEDYAEVGTTFGGEDMWP